MRFLDLPDEPGHPERASVDGADRSTPRRRELPDPDERGRTYEAMRAHASAETAGEPSDETGESRHDRRGDGAGRRGYRNEVPRFMEMWANHERRWPKTPRHAADPTPPDRDGGQRQGPERRAETAGAIGRVSEAEPELSADAQAIEQENKQGGWLEGFKDRLKGKDRLEEKVAEKLEAEPRMTAAAALREVADAISPRTTPGATTT